MDRQVNVARPKTILPRAYFILIQCLLVHEANSLAAACGNVLELEAFISNAIIWKDSSHMHGALHDKAARSMSVKAAGLPVRRNRRP